MAREEVAGPGEERDSDGSEGAEGAEGAGAEGAGAEGAGAEGAGADGAGNPEKPEKPQKPKDKEKRKKSEARVDGPVVVEVMRPGFKLKGKVLRPAMVKVRG